MAVELLWVEENLYELFKKNKLTAEDYWNLCNSLAEEKDTNIKTEDF